METTVKCRKCGRVLKNPASIAMGMGPKCAGMPAGSGGRFRLKIRRSAGKAYAPDGGKVGAQMPLIPTERDGKKLSRKEIARQKREERRRAIEQRRPFQRGLTGMTRTPLIYEPVGEKEWRDGLSGRLISQEKLQAFLTRHRFI
jgi:hypothetical protein